MKNMTQCLEQGTTNLLLARAGYVTGAVTRTKTFRQVALLCTSIFALAGPSFAQDATSSDATGSQADNAVQAEIIVTAQRRSQALSDVPMSVSVMTGDQLTARGVRDVQDLARLTPGLTFVDSGASTPVYSLRGVGFFDTALAARPTVSIYLDDAPIPFSIMTSRTSFDLERVEILKGPQGTLFGSNATGGAINYIAAKPTETLEMGADFSYGRFNATNLQGFVSGPVAEGLSVRIAGRYQRSDDWQYNYRRKDSLGRTSIVDGRFSADWRPSDGVKFALVLTGFRDTSDTQAAQFIALFAARPPLVPIVTPGLINFPVAPRNNRAADWNMNEPLRRDNSYYQAVLRSEIELSSEISLIGITTYGHMKVDQLTDQDGTSFTNTATEQNGKLTTLGQELRLAGNHSAANWVVGVNYSRDKARENNLFFDSYNTAGAFPTGPVPIIRQRSTQDFDTYAVFANLDYNISETLTAHGGIRYTKADLEYDGCTADFNGVTLAGFNGTFNVFRAQRGLPPLSPPIAPNGCSMLDANLNPASATGTFDEDNISWRAGLDWKPRRGTLVYFNISRGYKSGSLPLVLALSVDQFKPVGQESVLAYELGSKFTTPDRRLDFSSAVFYLDYTDKQLKGRVLTNPNLFGPLEALINVPKSRVWGAEAQVNIRPFEGFNLTLNGTYLNTKVTSVVNNFTILGTPSNFQGQKFPYTPSLQLMADTEYSWNVGSNLRALIGGTATYRSKTKAGFGTEAALNIDSYTLLDARAGLSRADGRWSVSVFGRNLTNKYYWTNVAKIGDVARRITGQPVTYGVQFSVKY